MIPLRAPERQNGGLGPSLERRLQKWLQQGPRALGELRDQDEGTLASELGFRFATAVASGTTALTLALEALRLPKGSRVLVQSARSHRAATAAGLSPVVTAPSQRLDPRSAELKDPELRAVVVSALFGQQGEMAPLKRALAPRGIYLLEDGALGLPNPGANAVALSFGPLTAINTPGPLGLVLTDDPQMQQRAREGRTKSDSDAHTLALGTLVAKLPRLKGWLSLRRSLAQWYLAELEPQSLRGRLGLPPWTEPVQSHVWETFAVTTSDPQGLKHRLWEAGVETEVPVAGAPWLALPLYPELSGKELRTVIERVVECLSRPSISSSISR